MNEARVAIVVLNWNSGDLGTSAVASARAQDWPDTDVIVVDNASDDDSLERIRRDHPDVVIVANETNTGFARGMNAGIHAATGTFVLPLNCDAGLAPDYVSTLMPVFDERPDAAAAGGRVSSPRVGDSGPLSITRTMRTANLPLDERRTADKLNGACPLFRMAALEQVMDHFGGPYDETYDMYGEDVDLALTLGSLGWVLFYEPAATASHLRSYGSAPRVADRRGRFRISTLANRHRNITRHAPRSALLPTLVAFGQDIGFVVIQLAKRDPAAFRDVTAAWVRVGRSFRTDLRKRRVLRTRRADPRS